MSRSNGQVNGHAARGQNVTARNLAQVPQVGRNQVGLSKYTSSPPHAGPYYVPERIPDRDTHRGRLEEQVANVDKLLA